MPFYHAAFDLPSEPGEMVLATALDFPGAVTMGLDLADAKKTIATLLRDLAEGYFENGQSLPVPNPDADSSDADLVTLVALPERPFRYWGGA